MSTSTGPAFAIGKFDALHLGHRALVERACQLGDATLLQFSGMAELLGWPQRLPLVAPSERLRVLELWSRQLGHPVQAREVPFALVRTMEPEAFVSYLATELHTHAIVVGDDFRFGIHRSGDLPTLMRLAPEHAIGIAVVPSVSQGGASISSSRVRAALAVGQIEETTACLGRPHRLIGTVVRGDGRGRTIGFPTANCSQRENLAPGSGVYAAWAYLDGAGPERRLRAAVNIGRLPTVGDDRPLTVEAHLLDYHQDCYGSRLALDFIARLRDERRFADLSALRSQIEQDVGAARRALV
jgi:riboflavin kinase/FMN adenylyltransferase